ncbi:MAG: TIGR01777 family oxidoreductase [Ignavibacteriaceae bacterium]
MTKRIIITGATGLIGTKLSKALINRGDQVIIFSRNSSKAKMEIPDAYKYVEWDYDRVDHWQSEINGVDAVIHLAGANVFGKRWNVSYKKNILESRIVSTSNLVKAIINSSSKPSVFISSSAIGFYGDKGNEIIDETSFPGDDFLASVCKKWEQEASEVGKFGVRHAGIRTGIVLNPNDGALKLMLLPFKLFLGGPIGSGKQWFPWIHVDDIVRIYLFSLDNTLIKGVVNAASPNPVTMKDFARTLGKILHRPYIFPVPRFAMKVALGEAADVVTASQRVYPKKLIDFNYRFKFENLREALEDLLK